MTEETNTTDYTSDFSPMSTPMKLGAHSHASSPMPVEMEEEEDLPPPPVPSWAATLPVDDEVKGMIAKEGMDEAGFLQMKESDFKKLGFPIGPRKLLVKEIARRKLAEPKPEPTVAEPKPEPTVPKQAVEPKPESKADVEKLSPTDAPPAMTAPSDETLDSARLNQTRAQPVVPPLNPVSERPTDVDSAATANKSRPSSARTTPKNTPRVEKVPTPRQTTPQTSKLPTPRDDAGSRKSTPRAGKESTPRATKETTPRGGGVAPLEPQALAKPVSTTATPRGLQRHIEVLRSTWASHSPDFGNHFYLSLLADPELAETFEDMEDLQKQSDAFTHMLDTVVKSLDDEAAFKDLVVNVGVRHAGYGVQPYFMFPFARLVRQTLQQHCKGFGDAAHDAWKELLKTIEAHMTEGFNSKEGKAKFKRWKRMKEAANPKPKEAKPKPQPEEAPEKKHNFLKRSASGRAADKAASGSEASSPESARRSSSAKKKKRSHPKILYDREPPAAESPEADQPGPYGSRQDFNPPRGMRVPQPTEKHSSALFGNNVYYYGGRSKGKAQDVLSAFNPLSREWKRIVTHGERPPPLCGHTAVIYGDACMYLLGGSFSNGNVYCLQLQSMEWSCVPGLVTIQDAELWPEARDPNATRFHSAVVYKDSVMVFGGSKGVDRPVSNELDVFGLTSHRWVSTAAYKTRPPPPLASHTAVVYNHRMWVFGGHNASKDGTNDTFSFDFATHAWSPVQCGGALPAPRFGHAAVVYKGKMLVHGGSTGFMSYASQVDMLNLNTMMWETMELGGSGPGRAYHQMALFQYPQQLADEDPEESAVEESPSSLIVFGGGGFSEKSQYSQMSYTPCNDLYYIHLMAEKPPPSSPQLSHSSRPQSAFVSRMRTTSRMVATVEEDDGAHTPPPATGPGSDAYLIKKYNRFNAWHLDAAFLPVEPVTAQGKGKKAILSPEKVSKMADRLSSTEHKQAELDRLRRKLDANGPKEPKQVNPYNLGSRLCTKDVEMRQRSRAALLKKYVPSDDDTKKSMSAAAMHDHITRVYQSGILSIQNAMKGAAKKYKFDPPEVPRLKAAETKSLNDKLYYERCHLEKAKRDALCKHYLHDDNNVKRSDEQLAEIIQRLFTGDGKAPAPTPPKNKRR